MANMSTIEHHGQLFSLVAPEQITNHAVKSAKPIRILRFELNNATRGLTATLTTNVITGLVPEAPLQVSVEGYTDALQADVFPDYGSDVIDRHDGLAQQIIGDKLANQFNKEDIERAAACLIDRALRRGTINQAVRDLTEVDRLIIPDQALKMVAAKGQASLADIVADTLNTCVDCDSTEVTPGTLKAGMPNVSDVILKSWASDEFRAALKNDSSLAETINFSLAAKAAEQEFAERYSDEEIQERAKNDLIYDVAAAAISDDVMHELLAKTKLIAQHA